MKCHWMLQKCQGYSFYHFWVIKEKSTGHKTTHPPRCVKYKFQENFMEYSANVQKRHESERLPEIISDVKSKLSTMNEASCSIWWRKDLSWLYQLFVPLTFTKHLLLRIYYLCNVNNYSVGIWWKKSSHTSGKVWESLTGWVLLYFLMLLEIDGKTYASLMWWSIP